MPSKTRKSSSSRVENPRGNTRERALALKAHAHAAHKYGAPVTALTITQVERAMKAEKLTRAHFVGAHKSLASAKQLASVARGDASVSSLPPKTRENLKRLTERARVIEKGDGRVPKLWAKKVAIALHAILDAKPARKRAPKPKPEPVATGDAAQG